MTNQEMTRLFSLMLLAWPNSETFKGGIQKLGPTIMLWTTCTADVDYQTGNQAILRLCKNSKFPPTIAEFRKQAEIARQEVSGKIEQVFFALRNVDLAYDSLDAFYKAQAPGSFMREVIDTVGGVDALTLTVEAFSGEEQSMWNCRGIEDACRTVIQRQLAVADEEPEALHAFESADNGKRQNGKRQLSLSTASRQTQPGQR